MTASVFEPAADGVRVRLRVAPKAARSDVAGLAATADGGRALKVCVTAAPEGGRANEAVVALLAKAWGVPKSRISVLSGATGRDKVLLVAGDPSDLAPRLAAWADDLFQHRRRR